MPELSKKCFSVVKAGLKTPVIFFFSNRSDLHEILKQLRVFFVIPEPYWQINHPLPGAQLSSIIELSVKWKLLSLLFVY